jgi:hypothetical protein
MSIGKNLDFMLGFSLSLRLIRVVSLDKALGKG